MLIIISFILGVANFAMHKAVLESGHPFVEDSKIYFGKHFGKNGSYFLEFAILLGVLIFSHSGSWVALLIYIIYTLLNMLAAWMLLSNRL